MYSYAYVPLYVSAVITDFKFQLLWYNYDTSVIGKQSTR